MEQNSAKNTQFVDDSKIARINSNNIELIDR